MCAGSSCHEHPHVEQPIDKQAPGSLGAAGCGSGASCCKKTCMWRYWPWGHGIARSHCTNCATTATASYKRERQNSASLGTPSLARLHPNRLWRYWGGAGTGSKEGLVMQEALTWWRCLSLVVTMVPQNPTQMNRTRQPTLNKGPTHASGSCAD